jgi:N-acetylglutamate synthase-like GNAT family acetyltransferase
MHLDGFEVESEKVTYAGIEDLNWIKSLVDRHRKEFSFVNSAILTKALNNSEILCISGKGFLHFHHRRDARSTLYQICVIPEERRLGLGRLLVSAWEKHARKKGVVNLQLKCPIDLDSNGFYQQVGFTQTEILDGKSRKLVVWNKLLILGKIQRPRFFASLSAEPWDLKNLKKLWLKNNDDRNPFEHIIYSPITCPAATTSYFRREKELSLVQQSGSTLLLRNIWFDCGAYQVQQGKYSYSELLEYLGDFYLQNQWADGYVLPDIPPTSKDSIKTVEEKMQKTVFHCVDFFRKMPDHIQANSIAPVVGKTLKQISYCIESYSKLGIKYIGFGSWGTAGKNKSVNLLSRESLLLFNSLLLMAEQYDMKVHCFGIGGTTSLKRLHKENLLPDSLDSTTWWKSAGFGNVFFPDHPQIQITVKDLRADDLVNIKSATRHSCFFCQDIQDLKNSRSHRIMHNLSVWLDSLEKIAQ